MKMISRNKNFGWQQQNVSSLVADPTQTNEWKCTDLYANKSSRWAE